MTKTRKFDCVAMKRAGSARLHEKLSKMTREEELEYWRKRGEELRKLQSELQSAKASSRK